MYACKKENSMNRNHIGSRLLRVIPVSAIILSAAAALLFSDIISNDIREGARLAFNSVIGSTLPFMLLSDLMTGFLHFGRGGFAARIFERVFKINGAAVGAFIFGTVCGFPVGIRAAKALYDRGMLKKDEYERLISFVNLPGAAFVISAVGVGMRGSLIDGVLLYCAMLLSSAVLGVLLGIGRRASSFEGDGECFKYSFSDSVKNGASASLTITAFIALFSAACGLVRHFVKSDIISAVIASFLEIGNAARLISSLDADGCTSLCITAFAICFSGISIHQQSVTMFPSEAVNLRRYYGAKLLQGIIGAALAAVLFSLFAP